MSHADTAGMPGDDAFAALPPKRSRLRIVGLVVLVLVLIAQAAALGYLRQEMDAQQVTIDAQGRTIEAAEDSISSLTTGIAAVRGDIIDLDAFRTRTEQWQTGLEDYTESLNKVILDIYDDINSIPTTYYCDPSYIFDYSYSFTCNG